jgi:phosphopantothenoylcysteine synthetase/decarboxylase
MLLADWDVCVVATPQAMKFLKADEITDMTGHVVRYAWKQVEEPDVLPVADAMLVAPATFNTMNKWAHGISDTLALGLLNEAVGLDIPVVAMPFPNTALARHPAFIRSVQQLRDLGVCVVFDPDTYPLPTPNMGPQSAALFRWDRLYETMEDVARSLRDEQS